MALVVEASRWRNGNAGFERDIWGSKRCEKNGVSRDTRGAAMLQGVEQSNSLLSFCSSMHIWAQTSAQNVCRNCGNRNSDRTQHISISNDRAEVKHIWGVRFCYQESMQRTVHGVFAAAQSLQTESFKGKLDLRSCFRVPHLFPLFWDVSLRPTRPRTHSCCSYLQAGFSEVNYQQTLL